MPRLQGQRSNTGLYTALAVVVLLLIALLALDYFGMIALLPNFGS